MSSKSRDGRIQRLGFAMIACFTVCVALIVWLAA